MTHANRFSLCIRGFANVCCAFFLLIAIRPASAQEYGEGVQVQGAKTVAGVSTDQGCNMPLRKPLTLRSQSGKLELDLYLGYRLVWFKVGEDPDQVSRPLDSRSRGDRDARAHFMRHNIRQ